MDDKKKEVSQISIDAFVKLSSLLGQYFSAKQFKEELQEFSKLEWYILNFLCDNPNTTQENLIDLIPAEDTAIRRAIRRLGRRNHIHHIVQTESVKNALALTTTGQQINTVIKEIDRDIATEILRNISDNHKEDFQNYLQNILKLLS